MEKELKNITNSILSATKYRLIDFVVRGDIRNRVVEVYIDSADNLDLNEMAEINLKLSKEFDAAGLGSSVAKLIVSSPGADKPLLYFWQLKKHVGKLLSFKFKEESFEGKLLGTDEQKNAFTIQSGKGKSTEDIGFEFSEIKDLKIKLPF